ncbi:hypothetical protein [Phenylobacterium sp.]|uniref:hypothetical protein n=1 Tax=Phenylobacterium sp. TaxID=1871053 RepID=UPI0027319AD2|nr:hypothetical protein [Phenylobacterium sp.]MDP1619124.1 hypothetical protein [Phenylobacterium sp.]MDP1987646.1 hypothetical protein [Phenylobacterium sp.]
MPEQPDFEPQDQAEVFDEDNTIGAGDDIPPAEMRTFEEMPAVRDETSALGDADDDEALIAEDLDDDEIVALARDEQDGLSRDGDDPQVQAAEPVGTMGGADEPTLIDAGRLSGAAEDADGSDLESTRLDDADLQELGYKRD